MYPAERSARLSRLSTVFAGLQAGVAGVLGMLFWLGLNAEWNRRSFWTAPNLMASTFYGDASIHSGFGRGTVTGIALYVVLYGLAGVFFAAVTATRPRGWRLAALGAAFGVFSYFLLFGFAFRRVSPLVALLHASRPTLLGHVLYGGIVAHYRDQAGPSPLPPGAPPLPQPVETVTTYSELSDD